MNRVRLLAAMAMVLSATAAGCGGGGSGTSEGGVFRYGFPGELDSPNPFVAQTLPGIAIRTAIYPELVQYDEKFQIVGDFASSWTTSADGKTWTFKTRTGKWSDGQPLTAKDAAWTLNTIQKYRKGGAAQLA